jgi:hypothetical protein
MFRLAWAPVLGLVWPTVATRSQSSECTSPTVSPMVTGLTLSMTLTLGASAMWTDTFSLATPAEIQRARYIAQCCFVSYLSCKLLCADGCHDRQLVVC